MNQDFQSSVTLAEPVKEFDKTICEAFAECCIQLAKSRGLPNIESQRAKLVEIAELSRG